MVSFLKLNTGQPQVPLGGGYGPAPYLPNMRAPVPAVAPAGEGPIAGGIMFDRGSFLSPPPMGGRAVSGVDAIIEGDLKHGVWMY